ncbi:MAG: ATP-binding cassette domain-containing protein [Verrucomicrobiota bacterium]|nr:ATP-binding cassette domain-containing protein [Verrucomicrobiota bacterium]
MSSTSSPPLIVCEHVHVAYGRQEVLHDVCLEIPRGVLLPFVGPNGAGKTTLLRAILGLVKPARGRILTPFAANPAGYVPQHKAIDPLYPVTTRQIVDMGIYPELGWWRRPNREQSERVDRVLARLGLAEHQRKTFGELSGGMKQKALLGRALVSGADVFVMDEPTSELDERSEKDMLAHLEALCRDDGRTVLLAHHGIEQAALLTASVCVVHHGRARVADIAHARELLAGTSSTGATPLERGVAGAAAEVAPSLGRSAR